MKVVVFPHHLEIGGSQVNAIDLATEMRDRHGHEIVFFATDGPARALLDDRELRLVVAPRPSGHPSVAVARALGNVIDREQPALVHAWDWPQAVDGLFGVGVRDVPLLCSEMSMAVVDVVPRHIPLTLGTEELVAEASSQRSGITELLEPPVDTRANHPGAADGLEFRRAHGIEAEIAVVVVSRLVSWLKQEGIERAIAAIGRLATTHAVRLVVVGDGTAAPALRVCGAEANARVGHEVVTFTGALVDPRAAYDAADIMIGMGGSALRGMAFGKPLVVLGEQGFSEIFDPETAPQFFWQGYYGIGADHDREGNRLEQQLRELADDPHRRRELGSYGLEVATTRYSLSSVADQLDSLYRRTGGTVASRPTVLAEGARIAARRTAGAVRTAVRHRT